MNEDARNEDTVTGRALGTIAAIGIGAAGIGFGVHMVGKAGKAATGAIKKNIVSPIANKMDKRKAMKDLHNAQEVLAGDLSKLKEGQTYYKKNGVNAVINDNAYKRHRANFNKSLSEDAPEINYAGKPLRRTMRDRDIEKRIANKENLRRRRAERDARAAFTERDVVEPNGSFLDFNKKLDEQNTIDEKVKHDFYKNKNEDLLRREQMIKDAKEGFSETNMLAYQYQKEQEALSDEISSSLNNMNRGSSGVPSYSPVARGTGKSQRVIKPLSKTNNYGLNPRNEIIKNAGLNPKDLTSGQKQQVLNIETNKNQNYKGIIGMGADGKPIYR